MAEINLPQEWIILAERDLSTALHLANTMVPVPIEIVCFHCQQAAEKYLKSFLQLHGKTPSYIHDLIELRKQCEKYESKFSEVAENCKTLTAYGVQPRYNLGMQLEETDMNLALKNAQSLKEFIKAIIQF
ncbi:hypothetical protein AGMMS49546_30090 [Spirochaetia bacterium]|nr:hypothetical protein AGMMS49546_30090 [Spirochaetia bacterium]